MPTFSGGLRCEKEFKLVRPSKICLVQVVGRGSVFHFKDCCSTRRCSKKCLFFITFVVFSDVCRIWHSEGFGCMENTPTGCADDLPTILRILKNDPKSRSANNSLFVSQILKHQRHITRYKIDINPYKQIQPHIQIM